MTDIVERLKSSHSMLGDPLHREAWEEIERLRADRDEWQQVAGVEASERRRCHKHIEKLEMAFAKALGQAAVEQAVKNLMTTGSLSGGK